MKIASRIRPLHTQPTRNVHVHGHLYVFAPTGEAVRRIVPEASPVGPLGESVLGKHLDPSHLGMLDQIAAHDPNAKVILPDGTEVAAIDARPAMEEAMAKEIKEAGLIDAAIACFLRGAV